MQSTISASCGPETGSDSSRAEVLVSVATLITEGRIPAEPDSKSKKFFEGPHCKLLKGADRGHKCDLADSLCLKFENDRETILNLCRKEKTLCIEVLLTCQCKEIDDRPDNIDDIYALEQWHFNIESKKSTEPLLFNVNQLASAIRSQLYFSRITAWLMTQDEPSTPRITSDNFRYNLTLRGETLAPSRFYADAARHEFPATDIGNRHLLRVCSLSLPRTSTIPEIKCQSCAKSKVQDKTDMKNGLKTEMCGDLVDDRMHTCCTVMGKHRCEEEEENAKSDGKVNVKRLCQYGQEASTSKQKPKLNVYIENSSMYENNSTLDILHVRNDLNKDKGQLLLDAIERSGKSTKASARKDESDTTCDKRASDIFSIRKTNFSIYEDEQCDSPMPTLKHKLLKDVSNVKPSKCGIVRQKISFDDEERTKPNNGAPSDVPSPSEQAKFRKSLGSAASMVFHSRTGLPLTSSPAPARRGKSRFDFDSSINSVSAIKSALFSTSSSTDEESESDGSVLSPCSPETVSMRKSEVYSVKYRRKGHAAGLLGSFEESVLNGRLEPVSTVHGFTAELGASGSFVPKHLVVPVTVFFYNLGDNDKVSTPYLSHINLGKKGYNVPKSGTVQVTLFNPLGTVVKMFVIMYDLSDMPANSQTFLRQRTLYMPTNCEDRNLEWGPKWLRYLIHLRFISSKSGKIYLHSDIRMIIFRKSDMDTATAHGLDMSYELRSFTHLPANPKFSPRK